jgi:hypothetical protein
MLATLAAASCAGAAPAEAPTRKYPELAAAWLPSELVFGARRRSSRMQARSPR